MKPKTPDDIFWEIAAELQRINNNSNGDSAVEKTDEARKQFVADFTASNGRLKSD